MALVDKGRATDVVHLDFYRPFIWPFTTSLSLSWRDLDLKAGPFGG